MKNRKLNLSTEQSNVSNVIDFSKLSEDQKAQVNSSKLTAEQNTDVNHAIDGVTINPTSINVDADLSAINKNVEESSKSVVDQVVAQEKASNGAEKLRFGLYSVILMIFALLI